MQHECSNESIDPGARRWPSASAEGDTLENSAEGVGCHGCSQDIANERIERIERVEPVIRNHYLAEGEHKPRQKVLAVTV